MNPQLLFYIIISILVISFLIGRWLDWLNTSNRSTTLPEELASIYDAEKYKLSQQYEEAKDKLALWSSLSSLAVMLLMFFLEGFAFVDNWIGTITEHPIWQALLFFGVLLLGSSIISLPFSLYSTFVIEEKFGFNRTTTKTFILDKIKGALLMTVLGGGLMYLFIWFYTVTGTYFWIWAWGMFTMVLILTTMFYASVIVPLFNKLSKLEEGELREAIVDYCKGVGFKLENLFVMDGSKRSSKANAFFSGLGAKKRIVLYDTLVNEYSNEEIVAVLAHEIGHYKKKHTLQSMCIAILQVGVMLFVLSLVINREEFSFALGIEEHSFHIGLVVFSLLYSPLSAVMGIGMNILSRKNEYEADAYAKNTFNKEHLISALKKLSRDSLSNLQPHPIYVWFHYSHPTLLQRIRSLNG